MRDKNNAAIVALLHPVIRADVQQAVVAAEIKLPPNVQICIVQGLRTFAEQNALYAQGRTTPGAIVTKARGGQSYHNYGLAIDFCLLVDGKTSWNVNTNWLTVVQTFKDAGFVWGGDFISIKDRPHFEKTHGRHWCELLTKHNAKDFIKGTDYVNL